MRSIVIATVVIVSIAGCSSAPVSRLHGHYTWGHEVEAFTPCGSAESFWVTGDRDLLQPLRDRPSASSQLEPYQPIYVEVSAVPDGQATDGFAADYDGVYRFIRLHAVQEPAPTDCRSHG